MMKSSSPRPIGRCAISSAASSRRSGPDAALNWQGGRSGNAESVAETCALLGVNMATALAPDNPARVAAAAKAAAKSGGTADEASVGIKL